MMRVVFYTGHGALGEVRFLPLCTGLIIKISFSFSISKSVSCSVVKRGRFLSEIAIISYIFTLLMIVILYIS